MNDTKAANGKAALVRLADYTPPAYAVEKTELRFELDPEVTRVQSRLTIRRKSADTEAPLVLAGQEIELVSIALDGRPLSAGDYRLDEDELRIERVPAEFVLELETTTAPVKNTALEGLYVSGGNFCTQCEAEGFRRITWFPDRPDVMTVFTTTIIADKTAYPVLLSNGNLIDQGELGGGRHYATWHDPFPKPSYLFALVAGNLVSKRDSFTTLSGREVALEIYVREPDLHKTDHAMASLKKAMRWDEETYGREYDLDRYMIVAVSDFNMGAMENKGLNLFNSRYVLASQETATDTDFVGIESVIAHEYFHNWSGNRVTCRDWFQLSLKEGFTVFRDQQFSADMQSAAVQRIDDVRVLRSHQFQEDAGPMAHPVRPDAYEEINNFYTATVYNKGAEVVRMIYNLLGPALFRKGTDRYFERYDGQAVTTEEFVRTMEEASGRDLGQFRLWYSQAGTPEVSVDWDYDAAAKICRLRVEQRCPPTPGQPEKAPFHIPLKVSLLDGDGRPLTLRLEGEGAEETAVERVLDVTAEEQVFTFIDVSSDPLPSVLRGFSAPVKLKMELDDEELAFLMAHDTDEFNRWDAGQQLAVRVMLRLMDTLRANERPVLDAGLSEAFGTSLRDRDADPALVAEALTLPPEAYVAEFMDVIDPQTIHMARQFLRRGLAAAHRDQLRATYERLTDPGPYRAEAGAIGRRRLRNLALAYLTDLEDGEDSDRARAQFREADNMTDTVAALTALVHTGAAGYEEALDRFYHRWHKDPLVLDKWFVIQATSPVPGTLARVRELTEHPDFTLTNPNRVRALIGAFCQRNAVRFHDTDGEGYAFLADHVLELDRLNPQIAARLLTPLTRWRRYGESRRALMQAELERILEASSLSRDVHEVVSKTLA